MSLLMLEGRAVVEGWNLEKGNSRKKRTEREREWVMLFQWLIVTVSSGWSRPIYVQGPLIPGCGTADSIRGSMLCVLGILAGGLPVWSLSGSQGWESELSVGGNPTYPPGVSTHLFLEDKRLASSASWMKGRSQCL